MNNDDIWSKINLLDSDIIISSTIKSGTTWLQQIVAQLVFEGDFDSKLSETSLWLDTLREYSEEEIIKKISLQKHRRFFKTHSPASVVLNNKNKNIKYIFITRDFRDVVWSFYNHFVNSKYEIKGTSIESEINKKLRKSATPYDFWKTVIQNKNLFTKANNYKIIWSYFNTIKTWLAVEKNPNVLILHFNDLKRDLKGNIVKISKFLGYNYDEELINTVYHKSTFEYMKNNSQKCVPFAFKNSGKFINKGSNKRWKNTLNQDDLEDYNDLMDSFFNQNISKWVENGSQI